MDRIDDASTPLPASLHADVHEALRKVHEMSTQAQVQTVRAFLTPSTIRQLGGSLECAPFLNAPGLPVKKMAATTLQVALEHGTLPKPLSDEAMLSLHTSIPHHHRRNIQTTAIIGMALTAASAALGDPIVTALIGAPVLASLWYRHLQPDLQGWFALGYLKESIDTYQVLHRGPPVPPTLTETFQTYFCDTVAEPSFRHQVVGEGFLSARALRIFGHSNQDIFSAFSKPHAPNKRGGAVGELLSTNLREQDLDHRVSLMQICRQPNHTEHTPTHSLLEDLHTAHFQWVLRERELFRHKVAIHVLNYDGTAYRGATDRA